MGELTASVAASTSGARVSEGDLVPMRCVTGDVDVLCAVSWHDRVTGVDLVPAAGNAVIVFRPRPSRKVTA